MIAGRVLTSVRLLKPQLVDAHHFRQLAWLDTFFSRGKEIRYRSEPPYEHYLREFGESDIRRIGEAAQTRVLTEHTSGHRALEFEREVEAFLRCRNSRPAIHNPAHLRTNPDSLSMLGRARLPSI